MSCMTETGLLKHTYVVTSDDFLPLASGVEGGGNGHDVNGNLIEILGLAALFLNTTLIDWVFLPESELQYNPTCSFDLESPD